MNEKIMIGLPIGGARAWILPYFLEHIKNIEFNKKQIILYFLTNNLRDNTMEILKEFKEENKDDYLDIIIDSYNNKKLPQDERRDDIRKSYTYSWLSELRNRVMKKCVKLDCTHLLSVDSDVLVPKYILNKLLSTGKPFISSLLYNGYLFASPEEAYRFPNILRSAGGGKYEHIVNYHVKYPEKHTESFLIPCDFTGACALMTQDVCKVAKANWHEQGEDEPISRSAIEAGFELFCDASCYSQHIMSPEMLDLYLEGQLK